MRTLSKKLANGNTFTVTVTVPGEYSYGQKSDHFSVTAEERTQDRRVRDPIVACGCMHDDVLRHFPKLADVVALHLADTFGVPMHAEANGWYWLAGALGGLGERFHGSNDRTERSHTECRKILAEHLRLTPVQVGDLINDTRTIAAQHGPAHAAAFFQAFVGAQRGRWAEEAREAFEKYGESKK